MSKSPWDLKKLREYIKEKYTDYQPRLTYIDSIARTVDIFRYHAFSAKELIKSIEPKNQRESFELVFPPNDKRLNLFKVFLGIQAETQAAIYNARSMHDIFAQIANSLLVSPAIDTTKCNIWRLKCQLSQSELKEHLEEMLNSEAYLYVNSFLNTIKHRNLVRFNRSLNLEKEKIGIQFQEFEYEGEYFLAQSAYQVLENAVEVKNSIVKAGQLLNNELGINRV